METGEHRPGLDKDLKEVLLGIEPGDGVGLLFYQLMRACIDHDLLDEFLYCITANMDFGPTLNSLRQSFAEDVDDVDAYLAAKYGIPNEKETDW